MDFKLKLIFKKSETHLIADPLEFTATHVEFKDTYSISKIKIIFAARQIKKHYSLFD